MTAYSIRQSSPLQPIRALEAGLSNTRLDRFGSVRRGRCGAKTFRSVLESESQRKEKAICRKPSCREKDCDLPAKRKKKKK